MDAIKREMEEIAKKVRAHKRTMTKTQTEWAAAGTTLSLASVATHFRLMATLFFFCFFCFVFFFVCVCVFLKMKDDTHMGGHMGHMGNMGHIHTLHTIDRSMSKAPKAVQTSNLGNFDLISQKKAHKKKEEENTETENEFAKQMLRFHKKANAIVREVDTLLKRCDNVNSNACKHFGCEDETKWEEILLWFAKFIMRFKEAKLKLDAEAEKCKKKFFFFFFLFFFFVFFFWFFFNGVIPYFTHT